MKRIVLTVLVLIIMTLILMIRLNAREVRTSPKIGVALSGGGAKGFAHIGVLKVFDEIGLPVDCITGTSMGSIVGVLYTIGYSADEIERIALRINWENLLVDKPSRRYLSMEEKMRDGRYVRSFPIRQGVVQLPAGLIRGQKIATTLSRLTWSVHHIDDFKQLPIPFACVATDIATGEAVTLDSGFLPDAIRASMAIPTVFTPIKIENHLLVDGGLIRNLPVEDVINLGAEFVIGVDVSFALLPEDKLNSFFDIITQSLSFVEAKSREKQHRLCNILIKPDVSEFTMFDFNDVTALIKRGEDAARQMLPRLQRLIDSLNLSTDQPYQYIPAQVDSIYITDLRIEGLKSISRRQILAELNMPCPKWISAEELEQIIDRVYSTQLFERVTYKLIPAMKGMKLIVRVIERSDDLFQFGLRYDNKDKAALLLNTTFRNLIKQGSVLFLDFRLGDEHQFDTQYFIHTGLRRRLGFRARLNYNAELFDIYQQKQRIANLRIRTTTSDMFLGTIFSTTAMAGMGVRGEYSFINARIAPPDYQTRDQRVISLYGLIWTDTFNRAVFPTRGQSFMLTSIIADTRIGSGTTFTYLNLDWHALNRVHSKITLLSRIRFGTTTGHDVPIRYQFFLGGVDSFLGLEKHESAGRHQQAFQAGIQYEVIPNRFIIFRWNFGCTSNERRYLFKKDLLITGGGITVGANTPIGPIEFTVMRGNRHNLMTYFNVGYKF